MKKGKSKLETVNQIKELLFDKLLIDMGRACDLVWMVFRDSAGENKKRRTDGSSTVNAATFFKNIFSVFRV